MEIMEIMEIKSILEQIGIVGLHWLNNEPAIIFLTLKLAFIKIYYGN